MPKKKEFDEESEDDFLENEINNSLEPLVEEEISDTVEDIIVTPDDEDNIDIVIEVSDDEDLTEEESEVDGDSVDESEDVVLSKHKIQGKHSLKYDSIFKGKKEEVSEEDDVNTYYHNDKFEVDRGSVFYSESYDNESYLRHKRVKERVIS